MYAGGSNIDQVAWHSENSGRKAHRVGTKAPNGLDIYDMSGNVYEWCEDVYDKNAYSKHTKNNPLVTSGSSYRVFRGGSWLGNTRDMRAADRNRNSTGYTSSGLGFRLCLLQVRQ